MKSALKLDHTDRYGVSGRQCGDLVGHVYRHSGNGRLYCVRETVWICDKDCWGVAYAEVNGSQILFTRSFADFTGTRNGVPRFQLPN